MLRFGYVNRTDSEFC